VALVAREFAQSSPRAEPETFAINGASMAPPRAGVRVRSTTAASEAARRVVLR
jgi:hypothetical protein